jgi:hypothetical protein
MPGGVAVPIQTVQCSLSSSSGEEEACHVGQQKMPRWLWSNSAGWSRYCSQWCALFGYPHPNRVVLLINSSLRFSCVVLCSSTPLLVSDDVGVHCQSRVVWRWRRRLRSCSAVGVPSLLAPSSRCSRLSLFYANATTSDRVTMSVEWMPGQPRPAHLDGSSPG